MYRSLSMKFKIEKLCLRLSRLSPIGLRVPMDCYRMGRGGQRYLQNPPLFPQFRRHVFNGNEASALLQQCKRNVGDADEKRILWIMSTIIENAPRPLARKYLDDAAKEADKQKREMLDQWAANVISIIKKYSSARALSQ